MQKHINTLVVQVRADGLAAGWELPRPIDWLESDARIPAHLALIHSEIVEAHAEWKPYGLTDKVAMAYEFADIQIRILNLVGAFTENFSYHVSSVVGVPMPDERERVFHIMHAMVTAALEAFREANDETFIDALAALYFLVDNWAWAAFKIDVTEAVALKMKVNRGRPARHGGKRI